jgi:hypothetical protein
MMIRKTLLFIFLSVILTEAFVLLPRNKPSVVLRSTSYDEILGRLQNEYQELQETLLRDLEMHQKADAEQVAEVILEKAVDVAAVQKYKQMEIVDEAEKELIQASDDRMLALFLHEKNAEAMSAEREAALLDSLDAGYEDMERLRDLPVDAEELEMYSSFKVLEAASKKEKADKLLKLLERNEAQFKDSLKQLRDSHNKKAAEEWEKATEEWEKTEAPKHDLFLDKVKEIMTEMYG